MNLWWCNQSRMWQWEYPAGLVCSSEFTKKQGMGLTYRKTVNKVKEGDLIIHYRKQPQAVVAFSRAKTDGYYNPKMPDLNGEDPYEKGWMFETEYFVLTPHPLKKSEFTENLRTNILDETGRFRQGYFFPFEPESFRIVRDRAATLGLLNGAPDWLSAFGAMTVASPPFRLPEEVSDDREYAKGAVERVSVNRYERDPKARAACIARHGTKCFCGFDFAATYGSRMEGVIHVHHLKPLASVGEVHQVDPIHDLRPVCPNCHAVLHRRNPPYSIEEVLGFLRENRVVEF